MPTCNASDVPVVAPSQTGDAAVALDDDMLEVFRRALLREVCEQASMLKDHADSACEYYPAMDKQEDAMTCMRFLAETIAMLDTIGWGD